MSALEVHPSELMGEIERLQTENWQLKQACGYPIPADKETINSPFKCGMCDARSQGENEAQKWHLIAMEAGAVTCTDGRHIYPLRDRVKQLEAELAALRSPPESEAAKWHRVAMEAGAITCVGGGHIYPLRDRVKKLEEALTWYADAANCRQGVFGAMTRNGNRNKWEPDNGNTARAALSREDQR